jgi:hypothetical protein
MTISEFPIQKPQRQACFSGCSADIYSCPNSHTLDCFVPLRRFAAWSIRTHLEAKWVSSGGASDCGVDVSKLSADTDGSDYEVDILAV